jgi:hypothetical protein
MSHASISELRGVKGGGATRGMRSSLPRVLLLVLAAWLCALSGYAAAAPAELTADEIAKRTLRADAFGWEGAKTLLRMVLTDKQGKAKERRMEVVARRKAGRLQSMVRFLTPQDLAGTAFLMLEQTDGQAEQYVYLSGLKRTRRVVGREREGSFMGSDFTYADMQPIDAAHVTNHRLPDDMVSDTPTYVIETRIHHDAGVPYGKTVSWVRKSDFVAVRTRFLDREGKLVKTLYARRVRDLEGKPVVVEARMQSEKTGHSTDLIIESMTRQDALPDTLFTPNALERL